MKTIIGASQFFKQNTPRFWQILGDLSLTLATIGAAIIALPATLAASGIEGFVLPVILLQVAKYCMAGGAVIKFVTKLIGVKEPKDETATK